MTINVVVLISHFAVVCRSQGAKKISFVTAGADYEFTDSNDSDTGFLLNEEILKIHQMNLKLPLSQNLLTKIV